MRGFYMIIGYILGNEKILSWLTNQVLEASRIVDKKIKGEKNDVSETDK